ncbi:hypothetical protein [Paeniglutamicibacter cryotolerans]|uniref:Phage shock protein PspC (Stress-responsive transcriptional regulator) n=1 Tax=Paeniglutamicibacter cryotolerans TaxID=670079 RepID=A0A839QLT6_9MICC|nr:hypothetical protein [Paeniglutamicibacter cryotolerans]MBB2994152.1 phage shock protein PspC (stress-responsive transcriptional regulator) [Paeniglutamicibacter cryotolerans]
MNKPDPPTPHDHQPDGDSLAGRYGSRPVPGHFRVTFGLFAFAKGWAVTYIAWAALTLLISIASSLAAGDDSAVDFWGLVLAFSLFIAVFIGTPVALVFGLLLRVVRRQWVHVAAFFFGFAILTFAVMQLTIPWTSLRMPFLYAVSVGFCAAVGRASVIKDVNVHPVPDLHLPGPPPATGQIGKTRQPRQGPLPH